MSLFGRGCLVSPRTVARLLLILDVKHDGMAALNVSFNISDIQTVSGMFYWISRRSVKRLLMCIGDVRACQRPQLILGIAPRGCGEVCLVSQMPPKIIIDTIFIRILQPEPTLCLAFVITFKVAEPFSPPGWRT